MMLKIIALAMIVAVILLAGVRFLKESDDELIANKRYETDIDSEEES